MRAVAPRPPEWIDSAPVRISAVRDLVAHPDEVFDALADHESWPRWFPALSNVERFGEPAGGLGSHRRVFIGRRITVEEEFNVWEPGRAWGFTITAVSVPGLRSMNERVTLDATGDGGTRVTYVMGIDPSPWFAPLLRAVRRSVIARLDRALAALDDHIAAGRD